MDVGDVEQQLPEPQPEPRRSYYQRARSRLNCNYLERFFYRLGQVVGRSPGITLAVAMIVCAASGCGIMFWKEEVSDVELFMAHDSTVREDAAWVEEHFRDDIRYESVIVVADNVLAPEVLAAISELDLAVKSIDVDGSNWEDVCSRYLSWFQTGNMTLDVAEYAEELARAGLFQNDCIYQSILKLWADVTPAEFMNFTQDDILKNVTENINARFDNA